jgi:hypothetical protein
VTVMEALKRGWNAFRQNDLELSQPRSFLDIGPTYGFRPDRVRLTFSSERSIISSLYTRLSIDIATVEIKHVRLDADGSFVSEMPSGLNDCLTTEPNLDQGPRAFRQDIALTLFDKGVAAIVPVDTTEDPDKTGAFDIQSLRVGEILEWFKHHVRVRLYNDNKGFREDIILPKHSIAIVENPLYAVMNEPNSTLQRLIRKLNLLDTIDEQSGSGKLDLIIQLPYIIKSEARREQAEQRRKDIEFQLKGSQYGIAYTDGTEKITQLNRPAENNLLKQVEYLTTMLYGQLGITPAVMNGEADEKGLLSYNTRTIEPIVGAIAEAMHRAFLTKTARTQGQGIAYFRDPFKLVPLADIAEIADKFTRNEILSANELRAVIGMRPSKDPKADQLRNSNMPQSELGIQEPTSVPG